MCKECEHNEEEVIEVEVCDCEHCDCKHQNPMTDMIEMRKKMRNLYLPLTYWQSLF